MNNAELQAFIQDELKKARARTFRGGADFVPTRSIDGTPRPVVLDAQGNEVSSKRGREHEWSSEYMGVFEPAPAPKEDPAPTLAMIRAAMTALYENNRASAQPLRLYERFDAMVAERAMKAAALGTAVSEVQFTDDDAVVGVAGLEVQPGDKLTFTVTKGVFLPWPAPYSFPVEVTITPESYRSLDADARTRTPEWQESVRQRFERRVGAALTSTTQRT